MPAPYPRRDPNRAAASKLNRGAPRGSSQARGLSAAPGQQFQDFAAQPAAGITVWEQAAEPTGAAVHDFWWDTDATP